MLSRFVRNYRIKRAKRSFEANAMVGAGFKCSMNFCVNSNQRTAIQIGENCTIGANLFCASKGKISIGDHTWIGGNSSISAAQGITIGSFCAISRDVEIRDNNSHPLDPTLRRKHLLDDSPGWGMENWYDSDMDQITIENDVWIGRRVLIMKGVHLGAGTVVAAGSIVTKSFPRLSVIAGNPAKLIKTLEFELPV